MAEFATAGSDGILRLWQADMHTLTASLALGSGPATALDYMQTMGVLRLPGELSSDSDAAVDYSLQSHEHLAVGPQKKDHPLPLEAIHFSACYSRE